MAYFKKIGILGGSFNPPHLGHLHLSKIAKKIFNLDEVWWFVALGNPLKNNDNLPSPRERIALCQALTKNQPFIKISDFEIKHNIIHTYEMVQITPQFFPHKFIYLMGADSYFHLHLWQNFRVIAQNIPIGVIARKPYFHFNRAKVHGILPHFTGNYSVGAWWRRKPQIYLVHCAYCDISSSFIRKTKNAE